MNMKNSREAYWNAAADTYFANYSHPSSGDDELNLKYISLISEHVKGKRVLEIGCGPGRLIGSVAKNAAEAYGADLSSRMIEIAKSQYPDIHFSVAEATQIPLESFSVDTVFMIRTMPHIKTRKEAYAEMARVLSPGGVAIFDLFNRRNPIGALRWALSILPSFIYLRADQADNVSAELLKAGLEVQQVVPVQWLPDASNLKKYLPRMMSTPVIALSRRVESFASRTSLLRGFALRQVIIARKI